MASPKVYINGLLYEKAEAKISVFDHGLLYGDGVFEGLRIYNGKVFRLKEHVDRLYESARSILLDIPITREKMMSDIRDTVNVNEKKDGYIRLVITRGAGYLGLDPRKTSDPQIIIIVDDITLYPTEMYEKGMELVTVATIRNNPAALNPRIKSLNYLNNVLAKIEAVNAGYAEALMLNHKGEVAECSGDNIFLVRNGVLKTPATDAGILEGITRNAVMELASKSGIPVEETALTRHDLYAADECFLTGTAAEVIPVVKLDGRSIGKGTPGPVTKRLLDAFHQLVRE